MHLAVRGQWNYVRKLEAAEYFLCKGYKKSSNYGMFSLPFSPAELQGTGSTALTRSSLTAGCHSMNRLLVGALTDTIHPASRFWGTDSLQSNITSVAISASQWLKARVYRQVWYLALFLVILFFYTIASCNYFTP